MKPAYILNSKGDRAVSFAFFCAKIENDVGWLAKGATDMKIAAYCRVSTDKDEQLDSLEHQKQFFPSTQRRMVIGLSAYMQMKVSAGQA